MSRTILFYTFCVLILSCSCQLSQTNSIEPKPILDQIKESAANIKLVDRRLRLSNEGFYWQFRDAKNQLQKNIYSVLDYGETLKQMGFRCESVRRTPGSKSLDLVQKTLRISKDGLFWRYQECKKVLIFRFKCETRLETYKLEDWGDKLAQMGFFCAKGGL